MFDQKIQLIIVSSADTEKYANLLQKMIGSSDDTEDEVVGVRDGSVEAAVWTEEQYFAQKPTLQSSTHILFIGTSKKLEKEYYGLQSKFEKYGMNYAWIGKQGRLFVDSNIKRKEYEDFLEYAKQYISDAKEKMSTQSQSVKKDATALGIGAAAEAASVGAAAGAASGMAIFLPFAAAVFTPVGAMGLGIFGALKMGRHLKEKRDVLDQQYACLIIKFYLDGLQKFLDQ